MDDADGVDADAWADVARRRGGISRDVGRDDGGDDAAVTGADVAAVSGRGIGWRGWDAAGFADRGGGLGVFLRMDRVRARRLSAGRRGRAARDAAAGAGARR